MSRLESSPLARFGNAVGSTLWRRKLLVLCYHGIEDSENFALQMDELLRHRRPVTADDVANSIQHGVPLPADSVLVTFDDGDQSVLQFGLPILRSRDIPALLFVVTELLDSDKPFWWDEVAELVGAGGSASGIDGNGIETVRHLKRISDTERRSAIDQLRMTASRQASRKVQLTRSDLMELEAGGVAIGSHTASHPCLDQCALDVAVAELRDSRRTLEEVLGHDVRLFAYPNGNSTLQVRRLVEQAGYMAAFAFDHRVSSNPAPDRYQISRVRVDSTTPMDRYRLLISGVHSALHHARGRN